MRGLDLLLPSILMFPESEARPEYEHKRPSPDRILKALKVRLC